MAQIDLTDHFVRTFEALEDEVRKYRGDGDGPDHLQAQLNAAIKALEKTRLDSEADHRVLTRQVRMAEEQSRNVEARRIEYEKTIKLLETAMAGLKADLANEQRKLTKANLLVERLERENNLLRNESFGL